MIFSGGTQSIPARFCILAFSVLLLLACGGDSTPSSGTSSLNLKVAWDRPESDSQFQPAALNDCLGVGEVGVQVYNAQGLIREAFWACEDGQAVMSGIPANQWVDIGVAGFVIDSVDPQIGYYGMASNVFLAPGPVEVEIVAGGFMPVMISPPEFENFFGPSFVTLEWEPVTGAASYRVIVANECYVSGEAILQNVTVRDTSTDLEPGIFGELCWWVQAIDGAGNIGVPSEAWWFYIAPPEET